MSGSAALASARRRRAGPVNAPVPQPPKRANQNASKTLESKSNLNLPDNFEESPNENKVVSSTEVTGRVHPLNMLLQHNTILSDIQADITGIKMRLDNVEKIKEKVETIDEQLSSDLNMNNISFYKKKYEIIKKQLEEIKKLIVKIQTFSMETNLSVIELKKTQKLSTKDLDNNEERSKKMSEVLTSNVSD